MKEELISLGKKDWKQVDGGMQRKWKIKKSFQKSLSNGSIKQSIYWIRVPSQKWKSSFKKRDNWEETSINN